MRCIAKLAFEGNKEAYMFFDTASKKEAVNDAKKYLSYYLKGGYNYKIVGIQEWKNPRMRIYAGQNVYRVQILRGDGYIHNHRVNHLSTIKSVYNSVYNYTLQNTLEQNLVIVIYDYYQKERVKNEFKNIEELICLGELAQQNVKKESKVNDCEKVYVKTMDEVDALLADKELKKHYFPKEFKKYYKSLDGKHDLAICVYSLLFNPLSLYIYSASISAVLGNALIVPNLIYILL